jgi:mannose-6-phosphate isomerase-like protein (cupin superfamily)
MDAWSESELAAAHATAGEGYHEFLRVPALSCGLYVLEAGATDPQTPHGQDEIYHVLDGEAMISVAGEDRAVAPGDTVYVAAGAAHRFHSIVRRLRLLVVFAPAEEGG